MSPKPAAGDVASFLDISSAAEKVLEKCVDPPANPASGGWIKNIGIQDFGPRAIPFLIFQTNSLASADLVQPNHRCWGATRCSSQKVHAARSLRWYLPGIGFSISLSSHIEQATRECDAHDIWPRRNARHAVDTTMELYSRYVQLSPRQSFARLTNYVPLQNRRLHLHSHREHERCWPNRNDELGGDMGCRRRSRCQ